MPPLHAALILRLAVAAALGGAIGLERELHGRPAGFRTHLIVGLASALVMVVSTNFPYVQIYPQGIPLAIDTSRIASAVVSGIGFLGAGAILRTGISIQGLTTAATLWLDAAIGLAIGSGLYIEGLTTTAIALIALVVLRAFERKSVYAERVAASFTVPAGHEGEARRLLAHGERQVVPLEVSDTAESGLLHVSVEISGNESLTVDDVRQTLRGLDGLRGLRVTRITH